MKIENKTKSTKFGLIKIIVLIVIIAFIAYNISYGIGKFRAHKANNIEHKAE